MSPRGLQVLKTVLGHLKCRNPKMPYYAVARGREVGVYLTWDDCHEQTYQFRGAMFKKFDSKNDAWNFVKQNRFKSVKPLSEVADAKEGECKKKSEQQNPKIESQTPPVFNPRPAAATFEQRLDVLETNLLGKIQELEKRVNVLESRQSTEEVVESTVRRNEESFSSADAEKYKVSTLKRKLLDQSNEIIKPKSSRSYFTSAQNSVNIPDQYLSSETLEENSKSSSQSVPFKVDSEGYVEVYTDGACSKNACKGAKAGIGVWFNEGHPLNVSAPVEGRAANNVAEIQAATAAAQVAASCGILKLCIITDSQFTINCMTQWIDCWKKNNWKTYRGHGVINKEEILALESACNALESVKWLHVRGHIGIRGNECADALARSGAERYIIPTSL